MALILGDCRKGIGFEAMDEILASAEIAPNLSLYVASLSRQTLVDAGAVHLGAEGYFLFEITKGGLGPALTVLSKFSSLETALRFADTLSGLMRSPPEAMVA